MLPDDDKRYAIETCRSSEKWFKINDIQLVHLLVVWYLVSVSYFKRVCCSETLSFLQVFFFLVRNNLGIFYSIWSILHCFLIDCSSPYEQNTPLHIFLRVNIRRIAPHPADSVYMSIQILQTWTPVTWTYWEGSISIVARLIMTLRYFDAALKSVAVSMSNELSFVFVSVILQSWKCCGYCRFNVQHIYSGFRHLR